MHVEMEMMYHLQVNEDSVLVTAGLHNMATKCFHNNESRKLLHSCSTSVEEISRDFQWIFRFSLFKNTFHPQCSLIAYGSRHEGKQQLQQSFAEKTWTYVDVLTL